jgi:hypothetical protein
MAKQKFANKAEAKEALAQAKEERKAAKEELRAFEKENDLEKGGDHSANKKWAKLNGSLEKKEALIAEIEESMKDLKSEKVARVSKYEYPEDVVSAADKKKFRAAARAAAKKAAKGETEEGEKNPKRLLRK